MKLFKGIFVALALALGVSAAFAATSAIEQAPQAGDGTEGYCPPIC